MRKQVYAHIVTYNPTNDISLCLESVLAQQDSSIQVTLTLRDNASQVAIPFDELKKSFADRLRIVRNAHNLGFSGAHNQGVSEFLESSADYFLVLNSDLKLGPGCLKALIDTAERVGAEFATPLLLRCNEKLEPIEPAVVDAAGMVLRKSIRHFDRGSGSPLLPEFEIPAFVFGGTGACLLISRKGVLDCLLHLEAWKQDLYACYPVLGFNTGSRAELFDEAFFAYREDADLAWRAQALGCRCVFVPQARAFHRRCVLPENRSQQQAFLNLLGVKNRFLLQFNNFFPELGWGAILSGVLLRNLIVLLGVFVLERSSIPGLFEAWKLRRRAWALRTQVRKKSLASASQRSISRWLTQDSEPLQ